MNRAEHRTAREANPREDLRNAAPAVRSGNLTIGAKHGTARGHDQRTQHPRAETPRKPPAQPELNRKPARTTDAAEKKQYKRSDTNATSPKRANTDPKNPPTPTPR